MAMVSPTVYELGSPLDEYSAARGRLTALLLSVTSFALSGLGLAASPRNGDTLAVLAVIGLFLGIGFLLYWYRERGQRVELYDDGLVYHHRRTTLTCRWTDITTIREKSREVQVYFVPVSTSRRYTIDTAHGKRITLTNSVHRVAQLGTTIQAKTTPHLLSAAAKQIEHGQAVSFGKWSISAEGLHKGKQGKTMLAWRELREIGARDGYIIIKRQGSWLPWSRSRAEKLPNLAVFVALVVQLHAAACASHNSPVAQTVSI